MTFIRRIVVGASTARLRVKLVDGPAGTGAGALSESAHLIVSIARMLTAQFSRRSDLNPDVERSLAQFRHRIFIEKMKWPLAATGDKERDQFDRPDTVYVIARDDSKAICGCGRLLPTTSPYLLQEVFPQLMAGAPLPADSEVWELSRFAIDNRDQKLTADEAWAHTCQLVASVVECALQLGATRLIAFSHIGNKRLLRRMGVNVSRIAPPQWIGGQPVLPFWIELDAITRHALSIETSERTTEDAIS
jgi:acyl homoserine lactone synthase